MRWLKILFRKLFEESIKVKVIIAGSRTITSTQLLEEAIRLSGFQITTVVSGGAVGVDRMGEKWALNNSRSLAIFEAKWDKLGKRAGFVRNKEMADHADALIALWDGVSKGTAHMIKQAERNGLKVYVHLVEEHENNAR